MTVNLLTYVQLCSNRAILYPFFKKHSINHRILLLNVAFCELKMRKEHGFIDRVIICNPCRSIRKPTIYIVEILLNYTVFASFYSQLKGVPMTLCKGVCMNLHFDTAFSFFLQISVQKYWVITFFFYWWLLSGLKKRIQQCRIIKEQAKKVGFSFLFSIFLRRGAFRIISISMKAQNMLQFYQRCVSDKSKSEFPFDKKEVTMADWNGFYRVISQTLQWAGNKWTSRWAITTRVD